MAAWLQRYDIACRSDHEAERPVNLPVFRLFERGCGIRESEALRVAASGTIPPH
jgi:hypothetical protein